MGLRVLKHPLSYAKSWRYTQTGAGNWHSSLAHYVGRGTKISRALTRAVLLEGECTAFLASGSEWGRVSTSTCAASLELLGVKLLPAADFQLFETGIPPRLLRGQLDPFLRKNEMCGALLRCIHHEKPNNRASSA